jgi:hypothetical protein
MSIDLEEKKQHNPLLSKLKLPGKIFTLPSRGLPYTKGEISDECKAKGGELQVKPMSALAEIKLRSADLLYSGTAIDEVMRECVPDVNKPLSLASQDLDALLVYLRVVTYGEQLSIESQHDCENSKPHTYGLQLGDVVQKGLKNLLGDEHYSLAYSVTLSNGQVVRLKPQSFGEVISFIQETQLANSSKEGFTAAVTQKLFQMNLMSSIASVDGIDDPEMIRDWLTGITPIMRNAIVKQAEAANTWGFDLKPTIKCRDCSREYAFELPLNPVTFFSE